MQEQNPPLVIITTNDERELPAAFVRRCVVLNLNPPQEDEALNEWLCHRGKIHFGEKCSADTREAAANMLIENRDKARAKGVHPAGQAEYLDLLRVLCKHTENEKNQQKSNKKHAGLLETLSQFVYQKYPELKQQ